MKVVAEVPCDKDLDDCSGLKENFHAESYYRKVSEQRHRYGSAQITHAMMRIEAVLFTQQECNGYCTAAVS